MTWVTYRQFRTQLIAAGASLAVLAVGIVALGLWMRGAYDAVQAACPGGPSCGTETSRFRDTFISPVNLMSTFALMVPALLGAFWGAPLITRELETGTHRLAWTQSVTRARWLAVKLAVVGGVTVAVAAAISLLLTWAMRPWDDSTGSRFGALAFGSHDVAPIGYALFAVVLGATIGLVVRRTLPAMAITIAVFAALQLAVPYLVRPHLMPPVEETVALSGATARDFKGVGLTGSPPGPDGTFPADTRVIVNGYQVPGAWMLSSEHDVLDASGAGLSPRVADSCFQDSRLGPAGAIACMGEKGARIEVTYQPGDRYWPFQAIETGAFVLLAALLAAFCLRRIPRGVAA